MYASTQIQHDVQVEQKKYRQKTSYQFWVRQKLGQQFGQKRLDCGAIFSVQGSNQGGHSFRQHGSQVSEHDCMVRRVHTYRIHAAPQWMDIFNSPLHLSQSQATNKDLQNCNQQQVYYR